MKVLFVGATGVVARGILPMLTPYFEFHLAALEEGEVAGLPVRAVDICDLDATHALVSESGADIVVNCAIANYKEYDTNRSPEVIRRYHDENIDVNMRGAYHLYDAAAKAGVSKFLFISSMFIALGPQRYEPAIGHEIPTPANFYACTKSFGEQLGAVYAYKTKMNMTCLRLGHPYPLHDGLEERRLHNEFFRKTAVHFEDIACAVKCALSLIDGFSIYPAVSACDVGEGVSGKIAELGYTPRYRFSAHGAELIT